MAFIVYSATGASGYVSLSSVFSFETESSSEGTDTSGQSYSATTSYNEYQDQDFGSTSENILQIDVSSNTFTSGSFSSQTSFTLSGDITNTYTLDESVLTTYSDEGGIETTASTSTTAIGYTLTTYTTTTQNSTTTGTIGTTLSIPFTISYDTTAVGITGVTTDSVYYEYTDTTNNEEYAPLVSETQYYIEGVEILGVFTNTGEGYLSDLATYYTTDFTLQNMGVVLSPGAIGGGTLYTLDGGLATTFINTQQTTTSVLETLVLTSSNGFFTEVATVYINITQTFSDESEDFNTYEISTGSYDTDADTGYTLSYNTYSYFVRFPSYGINTSFLAVSTYLTYTTTIQTGFTTSDTSTTSIFYSFTAYSSSYELIDSFWDTALYTIFLGGGEYISVSFEYVSISFQQYVNSGFVPIIFENDPTVMLRAVPWGYKIHATDVGYSSIGIDGITFNELPLSSIASNEQQMMPVSYTYKSTWVVDGTSFTASFSSESVFATFSTSNTATHGSGTTSGLWTGDGVLTEKLFYQFPPFPYLAIGAGHYPDESVNHGTVYFKQGWYASGNGSSSETFYVDSFISYTFSSDTWFSRLLNYLSVVQSFDTNPIGGAFNVITYLS